MSGARPPARAPAPAPTRPTTARASWRSPARRTERSSPPPSRPPGAGARAGAGRRPRAAPADVARPALAAAAAAADRRRRALRRRGRRRPDQVAERHRDRACTPRPRCGAGPRRRDGSPVAKLAGILAEGRPQQGWAVLGIGLNVAVRLKDLPVELQGSPAVRGGARSRPAATLGEPPEAIGPMLERLLDALERRLGSPPRRRSTPGAHATRCAAARSPGPEGTDARRESTAPVASSSPSPTAAR